MNCCIMNAWTLFLWAHGNFPLCYAGAHGMDHIVLEWVQANLPPHVSNNPSI